MAVGWSNEEGVQDQIDATVASAVERAKSRLPQGEGLTHCEDCGEEIPEARRRALPGVRCCVECQADRERRLKKEELFNRRGSKDSQLR